MVLLCHDIQLQEQLSQTFCVTDKEDVLKQMLDEDTPHHVLVVVLSISFQRLQCKSTQVEDVDLQSCW